MSRGHHEWDSSGLLPVIPAHSRAKLRVFDAYLRRYVEVLTTNRSQERLRLTLIDGFAGGGLHRDSQTSETIPGSPVIMLQAMRDAEADAKSKRRKGFDLDVKYFFVEKNRAAYNCLRQTIEDSPFKPKLDHDITTIHGEFVPQLPKIIDFVKKRGTAGRALFILDQFGYKDVPFASINNILRELENAEIVLTFAVDYLIDYLGADDATQERLARIGLELPAKTLEEVKLQREWRRIIQFSLHDQIRQRTGAKYYTPFFIRSPESHRAFWLIHLSGHYRARDVMTKLHWDNHTHFTHSGRSGLNMLGYDPERDRNWTGQLQLPTFDFDNDARVRCAAELEEQLPRRIAAFRDGISFEQLFAGVTNETPADSEIIKDVLISLSRQDQVRFMDKSGGSKQDTQIKKSDILLVTSQKTFDFGQ